MSARSALQYSRPRQWSVIRLESRTNSPGVRASLQSWCSRVSPPALGRPGDPAVCSGQNLVGIIASIGVLWQRTPGFKTIRTPCTRFSHWCPAPVRAPQSGRKYPLSKIVLGLLRLFWIRVRRPPPRRLGRGSVRSGILGLRLRFPPFWIPFRVSTGPVFEIRNPNSVCILPAIASFVRDFFRGERLQRR